MGSLSPNDLPGKAAPESRSVLQVLVDQGQKDRLLQKLSAPDAETLRDINAQDDNGRALLHDLALLGWTDLIPLAVACGAETERGDIDGFTPLHVAAATGQLPSIGALARAGADMDAPANGHAQTPLHIAIMFGQYGSFDTLLQNNACPVARNPKGDVDGKNAYHYAATEPPQFMARLLAHPDAAHLAAHLYDRHATGNMWADAFRLALKASNMPVVKLLADYGVDMNAKDHEGLTPLTWLLGHRETRAEALPFIRFLLQHGADGDKAVNQWGETPLMLAAKADFAEAVQLLLDRGADPARKNHFDETALHFACHHYTTATVTALLNAGADVNAQDRTHQTPLHIAAHKNRRDVVKTLLDADADPLMKDRRGRTPDALCQAPVQEVTRNMVLQRQKTYQLQRQKLYQKRGYAKKGFNRSGRGKSRFELMREARRKKPPFKGY